MNNNILNYIERTNFWLENISFRFKVISREFYLSKINRKDRLIDIFTGARRVGKTFILFSKINNLLNSNINPKHIIYLTGEAREINEFGLKTIIENYINKMGFSYQTKLFFFIDETQEINNWQDDIKFYYDSTNFKFFLTGSSGLIINSKTSKLTGRFLRTTVLPLSFAEFLLFTNSKVYKQKIDENRKLFEEYLRTGGYPEYVQNRNEDYLRQAISSSLYRDLLSHYGIRNPAFLEELLNYLVDKIGNPVSLLRIKKDLKVDHKTAKFYLNYLQDVFLIYPVYKYGKSFKITKSSNPKYYLNDTGVLYLFSLSPKIGAMAENAIFLKFLRESKWVENPKIFYASENGQEIDFWIENKYYEVKYRTNIGEIDFSLYNDLYNNITIIVSEKNKILTSKYLNINFVEAWNFI